MYEDVSNRGIIQRGGRISVGNLAVGDNARIQVGDMTYLEQRDMAEVALRLRQLTEAVMEQRSSITGYAEVSQAVSDLDVELRREEPRPGRIQ